MVKKKIQEPTWFVVVIVILIWNIIEEIVRLKTGVFGRWDWFDGFLTLFIIREIFRLWRERK